MESTDRARLTPRPGRRFGITMAVVLALLAALAAWRDAPRALLVLGVGSGLFALFAFLTPGRLLPVERAWLRFGEVLSAYVTTPLLFTVFWLVGFVPMGLQRRTFGRSPIGRDPQAASYWHRRPDRAPGVARTDLERQF
jgi:hypothetical protein